MTGVGCDRSAAVDLLWKHGRPKGAVPPGRIGRSFPDGKPPLPSALKRVRHRRAHEIELVRAPADEVY